MIYDGYDLSALMKVEAVRRPIMAPRSVGSSTVPGMDGCRFDSVRTEPKRIEADVRLFALFSGARRLSEFERVRREAAMRLLRDVPCPLVLDDAPDLTEMAILDGETGIERLMHSGGATLTWLCPDPYSRGAERSERRPEGGVARCEVSGSARTFPVIEVEAPGPFRVEVDGEALSVLEGGGTVLVDAEVNRTSLAGRQLAIDVMSDYPAWEPGPHVVSCPHPFEARWVERWA